MQAWQDPDIEKTRLAYRQFASEELEGDWRQRDDDKEFSIDRWLKCCARGVFGLSMPEKYGGQGQDYGHTIAALEGLSDGCRDTGFFFAMASQISGIQLALVSSASDQLKQKYLPELINGERIACLGFSEESGGSDIHSSTTSAEKVEGGFKLNGCKEFITNSLDSNCCLVFAKTSNNHSPFDFTAFMVDFDFNGISHGEPVNKAVYRTCSMGRINFDNVFVPEDHIVGTVGGGMKVITNSIGWERIVLLATCMGPMSRVLHDTIARTKEREQFGNTLDQYQQVTTKLADMVTRLRLSRMSVYDLCGQLTDKPSKISKLIEQIAFTKLYVTESYVASMREATQIWGARGVCHEWPIHQAMRDSLGSTIWAGTSETLRNTIAKLASL